MSPEQELLLEDLAAFIVLVATVTYWNFHYFLFRDIDYQGKKRACESSHQKKTDSNAIQKGVQIFLYSYLKKKKKKLNVLTIHTPKEEHFLRILVTYIYKDISHLYHKEYTLLTTNVRRYFIELLI